VKLKGKKEGASPSGEGVPSEERLSVLLHKENLTLKRRWSAWKKENNGKNLYSRSFGHPENLILRERASRGGKGSPPHRNSGEGEGRLVQPQKKGQHVALFFFKRGKTLEFPASPDLSRKREGEKFPKGGGSAA